MSYYNQYDTCLAINAEEEAKSKGLLFENVDDKTDDDFEIGDIVGTSGTLNCCEQVQTGHFGVYVGDGRVVHKYARPSKDVGFTLCDSLQIFAGKDKKVYKHNVDDKRGNPLPRSKIKQRAIDSLTARDMMFCIADRNCFHFALHCRYGSAGHK